jgi:ammonium transporter, Amt family
MGAITLGLAGGILCYFSVDLIRNRWHIDDSLDVFAVHGVGGMLGSILLAVFASTALGGKGYAEGMTMGSQLVAQLGAVAFVALWSTVCTFLLAKLVTLVVPMRVTKDEDREGLDVASHSERSWELD